MQDQEKVLPRPKKKHYEKGVGGGPYHETTTAADWSSLCAGSGGSSPAGSRGGLITADDGAVDMKKKRTFRKFTHGRSSNQLLVVHVQELV